MTPELREKAIARYRAALTSDALDDATRATVHAKLGLAYTSRTEGDGEDNLVLAIEHLEKALEFEPDPKEQARTHRNLSIALRDLGRGDRSDNLERSLDHGRLALELSDEVRSPLDWADAQRTLGESYVRRVVGDRRENVETALACFERALGTVDAEVDPERWAESHLALAYAHMEYPDGSRNHVLESATHCRQAQTVFTRATHPERWAACEKIVSSVLAADPAAEAIRALTSRLEGKVGDDDPFADVPAKMLEFVRDPAVLPRGGTPAEVMREMIEFFASRIRETVVSRAGDGALAEEGSLAIHVVEDWDINAQVGTQPPYHVHVSTNLVRFCSTMSQLLMSGMGYDLRDDNGSAVGEPVGPAISIADLAIHVRHVMRAFLDEQEVPLAPIDTGPGHMVFTTVVFFATVSFLISHEFGHVIVADHRRLGQPVPFQDYADEMLGLAFHGLINGEHHPFDPGGLEGRAELDLDAVFRSWSEEIACDTLAASLALEFQSKEGPWSHAPDILAQAKLGIHLALVSQMILAVYSHLAERGRALMSPSHPPMDFRTFCVLKWMHREHMEEAERPVADYAMAILKELVTEFAEPSA